ncbi:MAG TPA: hypothetical protein VFK96_05005 [Gammaproteobacteria bacterium]|nr:hypothetical protein [Gammaproteobacteria bacterium]
MARLLINNEWYDEVCPGALYESEYERILVQHADSIYPEYHVCPFKKTVYSDDSSAKPDLALINRDYRDWWIIEVETATHSLNGHVLPQVRTLSRARYGSEEAGYLCDKNTYLDRTKVEEMLKGAPPRILVVVNRLQPKWEPLLRQHDAEMAVVEIFRSETNRAVFRVNGYHPTCPTELISRCLFDKILPGFMVVESPAILPRTDEILKIRYAGAMTYWRRLDAEDKVWLIPERANPLDARRCYMMIRNSDDSLSIQDA